jgi:hypothetical protein
LGIYDLIDNFVFKRNLHAWLLELIHANKSLLLV